MEENKSKEHSLGTGIISGIAFLIFYLKLNVNVIFSLILGILCYTVLHKHSKGKVESSEKNEQVKINSTISSEKIEVAHKQLTKIKEISAEVKNSDLRQKLVRICATCVKIIKKLEQTPEKIDNEGKRFLEYYLITLLKIVEKYYELQQVDVKSKEISAAMKEIEKNIDELDQAFLNVCDVVYHNELRDLSVEMEILKKSMDEDSFGV